MDTEVNVPEQAAPEEATTPDAVPPDEVAAKEAEIAALKAKLADYEQRAALPSRAGNPPAAPAPVPTSAAELLRAGFEQGRVG